MSAYWQPGPSSFDFVFVGGVPRGTTEPQLREAFAHTGTGVGVIEFVLDRVTGLQRGFAFVGLLARIDVRTDAFALGQLRSVTVDGQTLNIQGVPPRYSRGHAD